MKTPYNLDVQHNCSTCAIRGERTFCDVSAATLAQFDAMKFTSVYPKGAILFVEGETPRGVFILCHGRVKLTASSNSGTSLITSLPTPGTLLGLSAAIAGVPYETTAETLEPVQANFIRLADFIELMRDRDVARNALQQLASAHQAAHRRLRTIALSDSAEQKFARLLLELSGVEDRMQLLLTHEELAQMIASTRETVCRLLRTFKKRAWIDVRGATMRIVRREPLEAAARQ